MHCSLFIPEFSPPENDAPASRLAAAETLIARGRRKRDAPTAPEAWLLERFGAGAARGWPVAPYALLADGGAPGGDYWMRADPLHLSVGMNGLGLSAPAL